MKELTLEQYAIEVNEQIEHAVKLTNFIKKWAQFASQNQDNPQFKEVESTLYESLSRALTDSDTILQESGL